MSNNNYILTPNGKFICSDELYHHGVKGMKWGRRKTIQSSPGSTTVRKSRSGKVTKISDGNSSVRMKKTRRGAKVVAEHDNTKVKVIISNSTAVAAGALRVAAAFIPGAGALSAAANVAALAGTVANVALK